MTAARRIGSACNYRVALNGFVILFGGVVTVLAGRHFASVGWPLAHADVDLAAAAGLVFLVGYGVKAYGWKLLFVPGQRPGAASLAAAGGMASITGIALPGRFDDAVRIAVVRRHRGCPAGVKAVMLSLVTLALVDTIALTPFASSAAALEGVPTMLRVGFAVVAGAGILAALAMIALPRIGRRPRLIRFRAVRWFCEQAPGRRATGAALGFVAASWLLRILGAFLLLGALGLGLSVPLAVVFICAGAASAALPVAPAGAATQTGAGAGALVAAGVTAHRAVEFAVAAQVLVILAGVVALLVAWAWTLAQRHSARRALRTA